jgi:hypothetical protein
MKASVQIRESTEGRNGAAKRDGGTTQRQCAGLAVAAAAAVVFAGCGGTKTPSVASVPTPTANTATSANTASGPTGSGSAPSPTQPQQDALKYARCMRAHGVPNFPDPNGTGGFTFEPTSGVDPSSPAFKTAQATCQKYSPLGGGLAPGTQTHPSAQWLAKMVKAAQCMRHHGVPNFPDPTSTLPSPKDLGGNGVISNIEGAVFAFPAATIDPRSPQFIRAATLCKFPLHNH